MRTCEHCGREYTPSRLRLHRHLRFCSRACAAKANLCASRACEECGEAYQPTSLRQRWCSICGVVTKPCGWCGSPFDSRRGGRYTRFCSRSCANSATGGSRHPAVTR